MKTVVFFIAFIFLSISSAVAQKSPPSPPAPTQPPPTPRTPDFNPDSRIPEAMRVDSERFKWRVSVDPERLAGPENFTKAMSIAEFESLLAANRGKSDEKLAEVVSGISLTQRANQARRERWARMFAGDLTKEALKAVADASSFLDLPEADRPTLPTPTLAEQRKMINLVGAYLGKSVTKLPDFLATKHTSFFEDWPSHVDWPAAAASPSQPGIRNACGTGPSMRPAT